MTLAHVLTFMLLGANLYGIYRCIKRQIEWSKPFIWTMTPREIKQRQKAQQPEQYKSIW